MNSAPTSHQQGGHTKTGPGFKFSSERPKKRGIDVEIPGLVAWRVTLLLLRKNIFQSGCVANENRNNCLKVYTAQT